MMQLFYQNLSMLCGTVTTFLCKSTDAGSTIIICMYHGSASSRSLMRRTRGFCGNAKILIMRSELLPTSSWHPRLFLSHHDTMRKTMLLPLSLFSKHNGHLLGLMMMQWTMDIMPRNNALLVGDSFCS
jgi:hypothetical protein